MAERDFCQASLEYVFQLQAVQERKKFEFVEILLGLFVIFNNVSQFETLNYLISCHILGFMFGWLTFYHQGHEVHNDFKPFMSELQLRIQKVLFSLLYCL